MVIDGTQVKILAWYDNEWGYVNRLVELARKVALGLPATAETPWPRRLDERAGDLRNYVLVTGAYWADTLTDGAIRDARALLLLRARLHARSRSRRCSSSTRSSASSPTWSAAGSPRGSG